MPPPPPPPPLTKLAPAPVAPGTGIVNTLAPPGLAVRLHADFDRTGALDASTQEHLVRLIRPGAIILANLDISDPARIPSPRPADLVPLLDANNDTVDGKVDLAQLTAVRWEAPAGVSSRADSARMRVDAKDAARIRAFTTMGAGIVDFVSFSNPGDVEGLLTDGLTVTDFDFQIEAITLAGDPKLPAPTSTPPSKPVPAPPPKKSGPFDAKLPKGSSGSPILAKRAPGDIWIEVIHQDTGGADLKTPREVALFTIAPFLLLCGIQPAKRIFVVNSDDITFSGTIIPGNHNFVFDLMTACQSPFGSAGVKLPPNDAAPFTPSTPADTEPFYLIDGKKFPDPASPVGLPDPWIQDEIEIGYCFAPHGFMHVVLHCKRNRGLDKFVHTELPGPGIGLFDALHAGGPNSDAVHYGGNLEATPPISAATGPMASGRAGPAVKAHKPAPFGKILLGDSSARKVDADYRKFLIDQSVQPVLPIDTSWLDVGHVDEFISFVADSSPKGFKMLFASVNAMTVLLEETKKVTVSAGRTNFHRGKWTDSLKQSGYDEISVEDLLTKSKPFNDRVRNEKLIPIDQRLKTGLHLDESDIIRIPTYFTPPSVPSPALVRTVAQTVGMVNMLVVGQDLMIPKPFGPRMAPADAEAVLKRTFARLSIKPPIVTPPVDDLRWVEPGELPERLVCYYTDAPTAADRKNIIDHIENSAVALSPANALLVGSRAVQLAAANVTNPVVASVLAPAILGSPFLVWTRIIVPDGKVDVLEAYMLSVLGPLGVTVHFVDDWFYHFSLGEAHCATNAVRELPEDKNSKRWWDNYDPSVDLSYSP
jgi:hypothetical protein